MTVDLDAFEDQWAGALADCLGGGGEAALSEADELGRMAIVHGISIVDLVDVHHAAVGKLAVTSGTQADRAAQFLSEALAPFEMTHRGFKEANARLDRVNRELLSKNEELDRTAKELEAFSYSVSHDLRAPLRSIDGFSQALLEDQLDRLDGQGQDYLRRVRAAATRMGELIDALLGLSRVSRAELVHDPVDLTSMAHMIADALARAEPGRNVELVVHDGMRVEGDARLLRILIENLVGNAWKFTAKREAARIEIGASDTPESPTYFVRDDGAGFDGTYARRLFAPFQRLHADTDFPGTGIGLATVRRIVERHGGRVWAEGETGRGATFFFTLPSPPEAP